MTSPLFKTWAEVDLSAIVHNIRRIRELVGPAVKILVSVKADAYGHGVYPVSRASLAAGAEWLGVSHVKEALELRAYFPRAPIMILSAGMLGHSRPIVRNDLVPVISSLEIARDLGQEALSMGRRAPVHLMVDTGMGRIGIWHENFLPTLEKMTRVKGIRLEGICSHFSTADRPDTSFATEQLRAFNAVVSAAAARKISFALRHIANSGALLGIAESRLDMVRPGLMIYGIYPAPHMEEMIDLKPALSLKTQVAFVKRVHPGRPISYGRTYICPRETVIATLPIGYGDGYSRAHSNRGEVLVRGRRAPIVGLVTMDQLMVDVGRIPEVRVGDEVVLIGSQEGESITAEEAAGRIGTIPYEVLCQLGKRVSRVFKNEPAAAPPQ